MAIKETYNTENSKAGEFYVQLAGITGHITCRFESTREFCRNYLMEPGSEPERPDMEIVLTETEVEEIREVSRRTDIAEGREPLNFSDKYYEQLALHKAVSDRMPAYSRVLFHSSVIQMEGQAVAFTALSGTGKSTHARLWKQVYGDKVKSVNDDKPFMGIEDGKVCVFGSPWQGKHNLGENVTVPLAAVGIITRDQRNFAEPVTPSEAFATLFQQTHRPHDRAMMTATMNVLKVMAEQVPIYRIHCNMDPEAAVVSHDAIFGK